MPFLSAYLLHGCALYWRSRVLPKPRWRTYDVLPKPSVEPIAASLYKQYNAVPYSEVPVTPHATNAVNVLTLQI